MRQKNRNRGQPNPNETKDAPMAEIQTGRQITCPAAPLAVSWQTAVEGFFLLVALFVFGYFLWEQRFAILLSLGLLFALLYLTAWLFRPFGRVLHLWVPWIFLLRLIRRR